MNMIRWIASSVLSALLLPLVLGFGSDDATAAVPPDFGEQIAAIAAQVQAEGGQGQAIADSFMVIRTEDVLRLLEDGIEGLEPIVEVVQQVKDVQAATSGPALLPPGARLVRVTFELAAPVAAKK